MSVVPPLTAWVVDWITVPGSTLFVMIVPEIGARTSQSSSVICAFSSATCDATTWASAFANSS